VGVFLQLRGFADKTIVNGCSTKRFVGKKHPRATSCWRHNDGSIPVLPKGPMPVKPTTEMINIMYSDADTASQIIDSCEWIGGIGWVKHA
jgi:hypothetical protein